MVIRSSTLMEGDLERIAEARRCRWIGSSVTERPRLGAFDFRDRFVPGEDRETYRRVSGSVWNGERRVAALCYHGFLHLFRDIFAEDPGARITTAFETWTSLEDLEARKADVYWRQVGAPIYPVTFGELCRCEWEGDLEAPTVPGNAEFAELPYSEVCMHVG